MTRVLVSKKQRELQMVDGLMEFLYSIQHPEDKPIAKSLLDSLSKLTQDEVIDRILSIREILKRHHPKGERLFRVLWREDPGSLGCAYGVYLMTGRPDLAVEECDVAYEHIRGF